MRFVGLIIALILSVVAFFLVYRIVGGEEEKQQMVVQATQPDYQTSDVLVASQDISVGDVVSAEMLDTQSWPSHLIVSGFVTSGETSHKVVGMVSRSYIKQGEPLRMSSLANPDDPSFLAANIADGMRVATISTDAIAGLAGFLNPGDRVDVVVTHPIPRDDIDEETTSGIEKKQTVTETLLTNIKVLAVDQKATAGDVEGEDVKKKMPSSVSLEVSLEQAQKMRLAQEVGYVSLALRGIESEEGQDGAPVVYEKDLTKSEVYANIEAKKKEKKSKDAVVVIRGVKSETIEFEVEVAPKAQDDVDSGV